MSLSELAHDVTARFALEAEQRGVRLVVDAPAQGALVQADIAQGAPISRAVLGNDSLVRQVALYRQRRCVDVRVPDGPYAKGGHHFTDGATWVEGLAGYLALAGNARPASKSGGKKASNYAVGGARAVTYFCRFNLPDQVSAYINDFPKTSPRTLVAIEIGGNDVRDALMVAATQQDPAPYIANALYALRNVITELYAHGARKFLLTNVADVAKAPAVILLDQQFPGTAQAATQLSQFYNQGLAGALQYANSLSGTEARVLDLYGTLDMIAGDPSAFGFTNVSDACVTPNQPPYHCKNPDEYVFWDGIHPTKTTHEIVAQKAIAVISAP